MSTTLDTWASLLSAAVSASFAIAGFWISRRAHAGAARKLADNEAFDDALASGDLDTLGAMLRDKFGQVSLEALLDDSVTQDKVFKSLERLTQVLNQPVPDTDVDVLQANEDDSPISTDILPSHETATTEAAKRTSAYVDLLDQALRIQLGQKIAEIAEIAMMNVRVSGVWTGLAGARRNFEVALLPVLEDSRKALSPRMFWNPRLRAAMGSFLNVANRAIHGEDTNVEDAEKAIRALRFIAEQLPQVTGEDFPANS